MFVDSSAILAILLSEDDAPLLVEKLKHAPKRYINPLVHYEVVRGMVKIIVGSDKPYSAKIARNCSERFDTYAEEMKLSNMPLDDKITRLAIDALALYGKGSGHPARLNMADCFSYASAKAYHYPLLFKGNDFTHTDVIMA